MALFCPKLMDCEDPIIVIAKILSQRTNSRVRIVEAEEKFKALGIFKVKDLAGAELKTVCEMNIGKDSMAEVYKALETYEACYNDQIKLAKSEFYENNFIKTQEICCKLLSRKPNDIHVLNLLGTSYSKCGEYDKSLESFKKALAQNPKCAEVLFNIGTVYFETSQYNEASFYYYSALQNKSNYVNAWINYAGSLVKMNDLQEANNVYEIILSQNPKLYKVRNMWGNVLLSLKKTNEAKKQFKIAMNDDPEFTDTWNNLGNIYMITDKTEKAILHYEKASELNPNLTFTWIKLGKAYSKLNRFESAIQSFKKVLLLCPENVLAIQNLATIYEHNTENILLAVNYYKKLLEFEPNSYEFNWKLGFLYLTKLEEYQESQSFFEKCIELRPEKEISYNFLIFVLQKFKEFACAAKYCVKLGDLHQGKNNLKDACIAYTYALILDPENAYGHWKLGCVLHTMGHLDVALLRYKEAIHLQPNYPDAYCSSALVYESLNLPQKAIVYYNMALSLQPDHKDTLFNVSNLEYKLGNFDNAAKLFAKINDIDSPSKAFDFLVKLANAFYKEIKNYDKAVFYYEEALKINDTCLDVCLNAGHASLEMNKTQEALGYFHRAIKLNPHCIIAYTKIGSIYKDCENFTDAIEAYKTVLTIEPDFPDAYCNLVQCLQHICDWSDYDLRIKKLKDIVHQQLDNNIVPSLLPRYSLLYPFSSEVLKKIASKYAEQCVDNAFGKKNRHDYGYQTSLHNGRIRVGYVSSDFYDHHPTSELMESITNFHNKNKVEVFCYSLSSDNKSWSWSTISSNLDRFKDISGLTVLDAANLINKDGIHILVNMNGYTKGARNEIFALRPAPIQVLWFGYPATSGAKFIDYLITDETCSSLESQQFYSEQLVYMDRTIFIGNHKQNCENLQPYASENENNYNTNLITANLNTNTSTFCSMNNGDMDFDQSFNEPMVINTVPHNMYSNNTSNDTINHCTRAMYNIPEDAVVYCNFCQLYKIDPFTFDIWITLLHNVPNSVLWLRRSPAEGADNLHKYAKKNGINPSRIIFSNFEPKHKHMKRIQLADVFLDTPLYNANKACLDALWVGMPVVTLPKETIASRVVASQLTTLGSTSTITEFGKDYIKIAMDLGTNKKFSEFHRNLIRDLKPTSKLFDCRSYAEELEAVYRNMWTNFLHETSNI